MRSSFFRRLRMNGRLKRRLLLLMLTPLLVVLSLILLFRWVPVPVTSFMMQASWSAWQDPEKYQSVQHQWVPYDQISQHLGVAVIAAEDQRFPDHIGFDTVEIRRVLDSDSSSRGASTITQQLAKNLFLWSGRSYLRKGIEVGITLMLELLWSKERILEVYLNSVEFGNGIYGAEAASQAYFGQPAKKLTAVQAARLAAVLPSPMNYSVTQPSAYVQKRQKRIERQMRNLGGVEFLEQLD